MGSFKRQNLVCNEDGAVVELFKAAGGIPLLVSANPEFCLSFEADTHVNGKCLNPYDLRRTSGGSSSGEVHSGKKVKQKKKIIYKSCPPPFKINRAV